MVATYLGFVPGITLIFPGLMRSCQFLLSTVLSLCGGFMRRLRAAITCEWETASSRYLDPAPFARAAAVMRDRRHIADRSHLETASLKSTQRGFAPRPRSADLDLDSAHAMLLRLAA